MVELTLKNTAMVVAQVDDEDLERLEAFDWYWDGSRGLVFRYEGRSTRTLQGEVLDTEPRTVVDFVDGDPLNCHKVNLRIPEAAELAHRRRTATNLTGYRGVFRVGPRHYGAKITKDGQTEYAGYKFTNAQAAAKAYDRLARKLYGDSAQTNFQEDGEE